MTDTNDTLAGAALLLATTRALAVALPHSSAEDHQRRAQWAIARRCVGLGSGGELYFVPAAIEDARKAGLLGLPAPVDTTSNREKRAARLRAAEKRNADSQAAARIPRVTPAAAVAAELEARMVLDPTLRKNPAARSKVSEEIWAAHEEGSVKP